MLVKVTTHSLLNPPIAIGRKLIAPGGIKLFNSTNEANISGLNQIHGILIEMLTSTGITAHDGDDKPQIGIHHPGMRTTPATDDGRRLFIGILPLAYQASQVHLLCIRQEGDTANCL